jgi:hypothetical protein
MEKDGIMALYVNFNLIFFKNDTVKWLKQIINHESSKDIPSDFIEYLKKMEIIEESL